MRQWLTIPFAALAVGCASRPLVLPAGYVPSSAVAVDAASSGAIAASTEPPPDPKVGPKPSGQTFELPGTLPGASAPPIQPPRFEPTMTPAERDKAIRAAYPQVTPVSVEMPAGREVPLGELQAIALANSPAIRRASADVHAAHGAAVQAGLCPNPTVGYMADQVQPGNAAPDSIGMHGAFFGQLFKTAHKLSLAQAVAGYDVLNAQVALRRTQVDVMSQVRTAYFAVLVARKSVEVNRALADLADEVYQLQLKLLAAGEYAGYEPLQLYAQSVQARNAVAQADATARAAWQQLAAVLNQPGLPPSPLAGAADALPPTFDRDLARARMLEGHTDVLTVRNTILQAQTNLALQQRMPIPDVDANAYVQHDYTSGHAQFGVQIGAKVPVFDKNQGAIQQARGKLARAHEDLFATGNELTGRLAEALGRYEANLRVAENFRDRILPNLARAYQGVVRRYRVEPKEVSFNDVVVAQQNYAMALQSYLAALDAQWKAVVDVAALTQSDELYGN